MQCWAKCLYTTEMQVDAVNMYLSIGHLLQQRWLQLPLCLCPILHHMMLNMVNYAHLLLVTRAATAVYSEKACFSSLK